MTNNITIKGRVAVEPELKFGKSGKAYMNLSVPDQKRVKNQAGEWEDASATTWFRVTVFGEEAELLSELVHKGTTVVVTGRLISREFQGNDGTTKTSLEVDFATVAVVPSAPRAARSQSPEPAWGGSQQQADPWSTASTQGNQQAGGFDEPPF